MQNHPDTLIHSYWFNKSKYLSNIPQPASIAIDNPNIIHPSLPNIYIQIEPNIVLNAESYLINNWKKYHTIFTYNKNVLDNCPNAKFYVVGTTWIAKEMYENIDTTKKKYKISNLAGSKLINNSEGHMLRQKIHHNQKALDKFPITFFRSSNQRPHIKDYGNNPFLFDNKMPLFEEYQFAIIVENTNQINCISEKIMDCLLTKTIPIYYGCSNISDFFDTAGWIILKTTDLNEFIQKLETLSETHYELHMDTIEKNYKEAKKYTDLYENLNNAK
jgi:hypothetical protein